MRLFFCRSLVLSIILLAGCATQPISPPATQQTAPPQLAIAHQEKLQQIQSFTLKGRLGVTTQQQGFSGSIAWQHSALKDDIEVYSPLGGKVAHIAKTPAEVTLTDQKGHTISAADAESLTEQTLGFRLPLTGLSDWALGRPSTGAITANAWDANGRLIMLKQQGWEIEYPSYQLLNGFDLPKKVLLRNEHVYIKLLIEDWKNTK